MNLKIFGFLFIAALAGELMFCTPAHATRPTHKQLLQLVATLEDNTADLATTLLPDAFRNYRILRQFSGESVNFERPNITMMPARAVTLVDVREKQIIFAILEPYSTFGQSRIEDPLMRRAMLDPGYNYGPDHYDAKANLWDRVKALNKAISEIKQEYYTVLRTMNRDLFQIQAEAGCYVRSARRLGIVSDPNSQCPPGYTMVITGFSVSGFIAQILAGTTGQKAVVFAAPGVDSFRDHYRIWGYDTFGYPLKNGYWARNYIRESDRMGGGFTGEVIRLPDFEWGSSARAELIDFIRQREEEYRRNFAEYQIDLEAYNLSRRQADAERSKKYEKSWRFTQFLANVGGSIFGFFSKPSEPVNPNYRRGNTFDFAKAARDRFPGSLYQERNHDINGLRADIDQGLSGDQEKFTREDLRMPSPSVPLADQWSDVPPSPPRYSQSTGSASSGSSWGSTSSSSSSSSVPPAPEGGSPPLTLTCRRNRMQTLHLNCAILI